MEENEKKEKYYHIASLEKGLRVLEVLSNEKEMSVSAVAKKLGYNRAASHRFLSTLKDLGYVDKNEDNSYYLTLKVLELGMKVANRMEIRQVARPFMQELASAFDETVNLGYFDGQDILHLDKIDSSEILRIDTPLGSHAPAYCTALGKAILAHQDKEDLDAYFNRTKLKNVSPKTIVSRKALKQEFIGIKEKGVAYDNEELATGLCCVAAPVFDHTGKCRYAISVSGPSMRLDNRKMENISKRIKEVTARLAEKMGKPRA